MIGFMVSLIVTFLLILPMSLYSKILAEGSTVYSHSKPSPKGYTEGYVNFHQANGKVKVLLSIGKKMSLTEKKNPVQEYVGSFLSSRLKSITTLYLKKTGSKRSVMKYKIIFQNKNTVFLVYRNQTIKFKKKDISDGIFQGMFEYRKEEGLIFTSTSPGSREYFKTVIKKGKAVFTYYNRKNTKPLYLKLLSWTIRKNPFIDKTYDNDFFSTFIKLQFPSGQIIDMEYDIERHPVSWGGARLHRKGQKALRLWHLERISGYSYPRKNGQKELLYGYRLEGPTEEYVLISPEYPGGLHFKVIGQNLIQSFDGKIKYQLRKEKVTNQIDHLILIDTKGKEKRFIPLK